MTVALVSRELMTATRIADAASRAGVDFVRVDGPAQLPAPGTVAVVLVDWAEREDDWAEALVAWRERAPATSRPRMVLFGPHLDKAAHLAARSSGLGPMWARSRLMLELPSLLS